MVTHRFDPEETLKAFEMMTNYQYDEIKAMTEFFVNRATNKILE